LYTTQRFVNTIFCRKLSCIWAHPGTWLHAQHRTVAYKLANDGHDTRAIQGFLGHRSIVSTQRYTALAPGRFKNFWKD